jgi:RHS repeat-associated protein
MKWSELSEMEKCHSDICATVTTRTYNLADQLTSGSATYDNNGNLTSDGSNTYTWDRANRLLSMGGANYAYDGLGNRIRQTIGVFRTDYLNDLARPLPTVVREIRYDDTTPGSPVLLETNRFVHGPRGVHAQRNNASQWYWHTPDGLGSVRSVLDHTAAVLWATGYTPNGQGYAAAGTDPTLYGFTGEPSDANGLVYLRARHYSPALGQFINRDPAETFNRYAYVDGNPINRIDPSGLRYDDFMRRPTRTATKAPKGNQPPPPVIKPIKIEPPVMWLPAIKPPKGSDIDGSGDKPNKGPVTFGGYGGKPDKGPVTFGGYGGKPDKGRVTFGRHDDSLRKRSKSRNKPAETPAATIDPLNYCDKRRNDIIRTLREIARRVDELTRDYCELWKLSQGYAIVPRLECRNAGTWETHLDTLTQKKNRLNNLYSGFDRNNCPDPDNEVRDTVNEWSSLNTDALLPQEEAQRRGVPQPIPPYPTLAEVVPCIGIQFFGNCIPIFILPLL